MRALLRAETEHVAIVGKSWDLHVRDALRVSLDTNLTMIERTIRFLKERGRTVFFDAEHFFDGYRGNRDYAVKVVKVAAGRRGRRSRALRYQRGRACLSR